MKKIVIIAIMSLIYQAYALFGIGLHVGVDNTRVSAQSMEAFSLDISDISYSYDLKRDAISNPFAFGMQMYLDIPIVPLGFELGFHSVWASYDWEISNKLTGPGGEEIRLEFPGYKFPEEEYSEQFTFAKVGVDVTGKWYIFSLPPVIRTFKFYVGGGAGFYWITPLVTPDFIKTELANVNISTDPETMESRMSLDIDDKLEKATVFGTHIVTGVQLKIPILPISFNADYKYVMTEENKYGDKTNNFSIIKGSLNLYF